MEDVLEFNDTPEEAAEMKSAIARMLAEMDELREQRRLDQTEIEQAQVETRAMLDAVAEAIAELKAA